MPKKGAAALLDKNELQLCLDAFNYIEEVADLREDEEELRDKLRKILAQ